MMTASSRLYDAIDPNFGSRGGERTAGDSGQALQISYSSLFRKRVSV